MNASHESIKFEIEKSENNTISILDFTLKIENGEAKYNFYRKAARKNIFTHWRSSIPSSQKENIIKNEANRIINKCSVEEDKEGHIATFKGELRDRGYNINTVEQLLTQTETERRNNRRVNKHWFWFPYINEHFDREVKKIIKSSGFPIGIWRKERTLRQILNKTHNNNSCPNNCSIEKCQTRNSVYHFSCACSANYYGSSKRSLHSRINEHLTPAPSQTKTSVNLHLSTCEENNNYTIKIKDTGKDCVDARLREAIYINRDNPSLNRRDLLTQWIDQM